MARFSMSVLCVRVGCALPRRHRDGCSNRENDDHGPDACGGCAPAQAADGLILCTLHADQIPEDALTCARLHTDLELQLRRQGRGEHTSGSRDRSNMPDQDVMDARHHIANLLAGMVELMVWERGFTPPDVHASAIATRDSTSDSARARLEDFGVGGRSSIDTAKRTATDVEVLAGYIAGHSAWFAAHADAGKHSLALHDVARGKIVVGKGDDKRPLAVWSLAYPSRSKDFQEIGSCPLLLSSLDGEEEVCGGRVVWYPEQSSLAYCDGCDQAETIEWWRLKIMGNPDAVLDTVAAAAWLSDRWRRPVLPSQIANWASRGKLPRLTEKVEGKDDPQPVKDARGRQLYRLDELEATAKRMFGDPPPASGRAKTLAAA